MRICLHILSLILAVLLICGIFLLSSRLPADTQDFVEKKYSSWSGVLQGWISSRWSCSGSFISWLNRCASDFEKEHDGIYLEFNLVSEEVLNRIFGSGGRIPEMIFFSPGVLRGAEALETGRIVPVAKGGYVFAYNTEMYGNFLKGAQGGDMGKGPVGYRLPEERTVVCHLPEENGRSFALASMLIGMENDAKGTENDGKTPEEYGIDLGLPVVFTGNEGKPVQPFASDEVGEALFSSAGERAERRTGERNFIMEEGSLADFTAGETMGIVIGQKEMGKLAALREAGKGVDWALLPAGAYTLGDQLLLAGLTRPGDAQGEERTALAGEFIRFLLTPQCQGYLADIGALSAAGEMIYPPGTAYGEMEAALSGTRWIAPDFISEYPSEAFGTNVRKLAEGGLSEAEISGLILTEPIL